MIGVGRIGIMHLQNILKYFSPLVEVKYLADAFIAPKVKKWLVKNNLALVGDVEEIFNDEEIRAVIICSPTSTHCDYIIRAAENGQHVFCEKPIDLKPSAVVKALEATKKNGVHLQIGFNRRFDKHFLQLKKQLKQKEMKDLQLLRITSRDPSPASYDYLKTSGGIFVDMAIHDFDMVDFLIPHRVVKVSSLGSNLIVAKLDQVPDVDVAVTTLVFENGIIATIDNSRQTSYGYDQRIEILSKRGLLIAENEKKSTVKFYKQSAVHSDVPPWFFLERYQESFINELDFFFKTIQQKSPQKLLTGENALTSLLIALAAQKSLENGKVVSLKEIKY